MADVTWFLPKPSSGGYWLENPARSGGISFAGSEQTVVSMAQRWKCQWNISIRNTAQMLEARAFFGLANGRAGNILVPDFNAKGANWPLDAYGRMLVPSRVRRRDLDGTIYADPEIPTASAIVARMNAAAALRATTVSIEVTQGSTLKRGQHFSLGGNRLYRINALTGPASGVYTCQIMPPLRAAAALHDAVNLSQPICLMQQDSDEQGLKALDVMQFTDLQLDFVEAFP